jgi:23S rRNA (uracil1939-C5)-methyltransferase
MKDIFAPEFIAREGRPDVVITDPPRAGMHGDVVQQLLKLEVPRIVYVSCNPGTQARDLQLLSEKVRRGALASG